MTLEAHTSVEEVMLKYMSWNPLDFEHFYISPGMIDFNIRRDDESWERLKHLTQAGVSGGVTLCVEERKIDEMTEKPTEPLFCDLGWLAVVDSNNSTRLTPETVGLALALKGFITPPNSEVGCIQHVGQWLKLVQPVNLPIIIDAADTSGRTLYLASPCRLLSKPDRMQADDHMEPAKLLGGAINAEADSNSETEEVEEVSLMRLRTSKSRRTEERKFSLRQMTSGENEVDRGVSRSQTLGRERPSRKSSSLHNIHSALALRITDSSQKLESLCKAEIMAYQGIGQTRFRNGKRGQAPGTSNAGNRPSRLVLNSPKNTMNMDNAYIRQLAHYPENLEIKGVDCIVTTIRELGCKVHIANLSSALAVTHVHKAKADEKLDITCETCPHFLYFTDQSIAYGDTKFKNFPPIRDKTNCNFLWDMLKVNSIDVVCSQHIPIAESFKFRPNFRKAMNGINGLGFTLQVLWTMLKKPYTENSRFEHYIVRIAKWTSLNPAKVLKIPNRGSIAQGFLADFVIWSPFKEVKIEHTWSQQEYQCPYIGVSLFGCIEKVFVRGHLAYTSDGEHFYPRGEFISNRKLL